MGYLRARIGEIEAGGRASRQGFFCLRILHGSSEGGARAWCDHCLYYEGVLHRISKIVWKMGKETGGKKMEDPHSLKSNEMAECAFQPQQPLVCDSFKNCEGLSRVAFMDGNGVVMLGKVVSCEQKQDTAAGGKKK